MASYTENLNLLKKNPLTDGSDTFNIETMLNENWDKIDAFAGLAANPAQLWVWEKWTPIDGSYNVVGYVSSPDSSAYPEDGQSGDYWYTRLGQIGGATRIETGSYVGTGTYGSSNPNSLTFGFEPKALFIVKQDAGTMPAIFLSGAISAYAGFNTNSGLNTISWNGKTVSWYHPYGNGNQYNTSEITYIYIAIG